MSVHGQQGRAAGALVPLCSKLQLRAAKGPFLAGAEQASLVFCIL